MKCVRVVDGGSFYKCYFDTGDGEVSNELSQATLHDAKYLQVAEQSSIGD